MPEPVRIYAEDDHRLPAHLAGRLVREIESRKEALASNYAVDFPDYKQRVGEIAGLKAALEICKDLEKQLSEH